MAAAALAAAGALLGTLITAPAQAAVIVVDNLDLPGEGFNDPTPATPVGSNPGTTRGQQRLNAVQYGADLWGSILASDVTILVAARFDRLSCTSTSAILGQAGATTLHRDFSGALAPGTYYAAALADKLAGMDLDPGNHDIFATFTSAFEDGSCTFGCTWYYGLDASPAPPGCKHDLVTVAIHELGHGLGFFSTVDVATGAKLNGFDDAFMRFLEDHTTGELYPAMTNAERAAAAKNTHNLHWVGSRVVGATGSKTGGVGPWEAFAQAFLGSSQTGFDLVLEFLTAIGPTLIQNIVTLGAVGVQFFTVLAEVDHFQCYRARTTGFTGGSVTLSDRFGTRSVRVRSPIDLCAPADKNGENPEAPGSPGYLTTYRISTGSFPQVTGVAATNQFGPVTLDVKKPKVLLVPTAVSLKGPPSSPDGAFLNHFNCYDVRVTNGTTAPPAETVTVQTAFETVQVQPKKPERLCVPTLKNGEPIIPSTPENLLCYKAKSRGGLNPAPTAFLANQFGQQTQRLGQRREICIPTALTP